MSSWASTQSKMQTQTKTSSPYPFSYTYHFIQIKSCMICTHTWLSRHPSQVTGPLSPLHPSDTNLHSPWTILLCICDRFVYTHSTVHAWFISTFGSYRGCTCRRMSSDVVLLNHKLHRFSVNHQCVAPILATHLAICPCTQADIY